MEDLDEVQSDLFKSSTDNTKVDTIVGLLDIQEYLEARVQELFADKLQCPDELQFLKFSLMYVINWRSTFYIIDLSFFF